MSTITKEQIDAITARLAAQPDIPVGLGTKEAACSIAAINLALTGELSDMPPACMSVVIARWIIRTQDRMPAAMRNGPEWRALLPRAAGTGRDPALERRRSALIVAHMWDVALPLAQTRADRLGYGTEWKEMCERRTAAGARKAADAAAAADAAYAAYAAAYAAAAYAAAAYAAAADAAADAAAYAAYAADDDAYATAWKTLGPVGLLQQLVDLK